MLISERDKSVLEHIVKYCEEIKLFTSRFGDSYQIFCEDAAYRAACSLDILQIGELSKSLTDDFKGNNHEMPWREIQSMRNIVAHGYCALDMNTTWNTIKEDIPELENFCRKKLSEI